MSRYRESSFAFVLAALIVAFGGLPAVAGDATYGTVTAVKSANVLAFRHDAGAFDVLLAGVDVPKDREALQNSRRFLDETAVGRRAQFRLDGRNAQGQLVGKVYLSEGGRVRDLGVEMVRAGIAMPARAYRGYKYGELDAAAAEARAKRMGLWKSRPNR